MSIKDDLLSTLESNIVLKYLRITDDEDFDYEKNKKDVLEELVYHIGENTCSELMVDQLVQLHARNYVLINNKRHPYHLTEVYWRMQSIIKNEIPFKKFKNKKSKLFGKGILHVHHSQSFYLEDNQIRYIKWKYKTDKSIEDRISQIKIERPKCNPILDFFYETLMESINWRMKTGEWILFQNKDNKFHFIGLGLHNSDDNNDEVLAKEILRYLREDF